MLIVVLFSFALAGAAPWIARVGRGVTGWLLALGPLGIALYFATWLPRIAHGEKIVTGFSWVPGLGLNLTFYLDGLSLLFAFLITGIGALVLIYAGSYLQGHPQIGRFYGFLVLFMASMLGLVLAGNVLVLFVFWELTSISSYLLIGFEHERAKARGAALQALLVTFSGGLALFAGLVLLGHVGRGYDVTTLLGQGDVIRAHPLYLPILLLVLAGAFTKSAQMPFHFWLPNAMEAPTPVSAYLHSATMVKAGIFLLARLLPVLGGTQAWLVIVTTVGTITMVGGGILAFYQTDLKRLLAYSTISALGMLTMLLGIGTQHALEAMVVFLMAHALYKGALFMVAGAVDHGVGTRDAEHLSGLRRAMPITAAIAALAAVSLAGFGPVLSFIGKETILAAVLEVPATSALLASAVVVGGALFTTVAALVAVKPFWGSSVATPQEPHEAPLSMWIGPALLATLGLVFGIVPGLIAGPLVTPAVGAMSGTQEPVHLALWHGLNLPLLLSVASVSAGLGLFVGWARLRRMTRWLGDLFAYGPARWYRGALKGLHAVAWEHTRLVQSGYLRVYVLTVIIATSSIVAYAYTSRATFPTLPSINGVGIPDLTLATLMVVGAFATMQGPSRISSVAGLGVVGYGVALTYILYGAPDLAMTQFMTETLTIILFVFVFYHLPRFGRLSSVRVRRQDGLIAGGFGLLMTLLVLAATSIPLDDRLKDFYAQNSRPLAHGRNVVNVILVDFRALDTMGEITVLSVAAIGVFALLKLRPPKDRS